MAVTGERQEQKAVPSEDELERFVETARARIDAALDRAALDELSAELQGRRSPLARWKSSLSLLDSELRPKVGQALNLARRSVEEAIASRRDELSRREREATLRGERLDLTEVVEQRGVGHLHVITKVREQLENVFLGMGFEVVEGPEVESDWYNFTALNMPRHHSARSIQDSFYLDLLDGQSWLLRTQTSPVQIRLLERGELPIYAVAPGRTYRRDTPDASHLPVFHQIEGLVVDRDVTFGDLSGTIDTFVKAIFGGDVASRLRPAYFPFTEPSAEFEVSCTICAGSGCKTCAQTGWIELGGCGMVHPAVFEAVGVDTDLWSGYAFGFGIDRLAMMSHGIEDMRSLVENDVRFLSQF